MYEGLETEYVQYHYFLGCKSHCQDKDWWEISAGSMLQDFGYTCKYFMQVDKIISIIFLTQTIYMMRKVYILLG